MRRTFPWRQSARAVLGLKEDAVYSEKELKEAFRRRAKKLHPDAGGTAERFRELRTAYESLKKSPHGCDEGRDCDANADVHSASHDYSANGADFARSSSDRDPHFDFSDQTDGRNYSTRHFYRPYTSNPFDHGFTREEIFEAEQQRRRFIIQKVLKHMLLWGGLFYFVYVYCRENRIARAVEARRSGYTDASYLEKLKEDKIRGLSPNIAPHWTDIQNEKFIEEWNRDFEKRRNASGGIVGDASSVYGGRPLAVTFQGRPFTPSGVRGARTGVPKTFETYDNDVHCELDDDLDEVI